MVVLIYAAAYADQHALDLDALPQDIMDEFGRIHLRGPSANCFVGGVFEDTFDRLGEPVYALSVPPARVAELCALLAEDVDAGRGPPAEASLLEFLQLCVRYDLGLVASY